MKRFICLVIVLLLINVVAMSESLDLDSMSNDELLALQEEINQRVSDRGLVKEFQVMDGIYVCGVDIKPGSYRVRVTSDSFGFRINIAKDVDCLSEGKGYVYRETAHYYGKDKTVYIAFSVAEGNVLVVEHADDKPIVIEKTEMIG